MIKLGILIFILVLILILVLLLVYQGNQPSYKKTISGIILLEGEPSFNALTIQKELETKYQFKIKKKSSNDGIVILNSENYKIVMVGVDAEIPSNELEYVSKISHVWSDALKNASRHESHIILSVFTTLTDLVDLSIQFTKVASSILTNTKSIGIYLGGQSLILSNEYYVRNTQSMTNTNLPLGNWIYFGLRENNSTRNGYTIGLKEFGFKEIEIIDSEKTFEEIYKILYDLSHHVLLSQTDLRPGETFGYSQTEKLAIDIGAGEFQDGETIKVTV